MKTFKRKSDPFKSHLRLLITDKADFSDDVILAKSVVYAFLPIRNRIIFV